MKPFLTITQRRIRDRVRKWQRVEAAARREIERADKGISAAMLACKHDAGAIRLVKWGALACNICGLVLSTAEAAEPNRQHKAKRQPVEE